MNRNLLLLSLPAEQSFKEEGGKANAVCFRRKRLDVRSISSPSLSDPVFSPLDSVVCTELSVLLTEPLDLLDLWAHRLRAVREPTRLQALRGDPAHLRNAVDQPQSLGLRWR